VYLREEETKTLPLDVRACLSDLMSSLYSRTNIELMANKLNIEPEGENKFKVAMDFSSRISGANELKVVQKVVQDAHKYIIVSDYDGAVEEKLIELGMALEVSLLITVNSNGVVSPFVEASIKPDLEEKKSYLHTEMTKQGFTLAASHLEEALETYRVSYSGSIALFRNCLQSLTEEILNRRSITPYRVLIDAIGQLVDARVLKRTDKNEETKSIEALFRMLCHYGSHPEFVTEEVANFLYLWAISTFTFILKRYEKPSLCAPT